jgi:hypothetical protein
MLAKKGFRLTDDDIHYLRSTHLLRLATIEHLAELSILYDGQITARSYTRTQKRTAKLAARRYLEALPKLEGPTSKTLYALGQEGIDALVELGYAPPEILERRPRHKELKPLFLRHFMLMKEVQVKLLLQCRSSSISIPIWDESHSRYDYVTTQEHKGNRTISIRRPVRPDAFFVIRDAARPEDENEIACVLEADRSQERHEILRDKVKAYVAYYQQELAFEKWGYEFFQVLVVTPTDERAKELREDLQKLIPAQLRPHYLFTGIEALSLNMLIPD